MKALPILLVLLMLWSAIWRPGPGDYVARELELERFKMYVQTFKIRHGNSLLSVQARAARRGRVCGGHPPMHIRLFRQRHSRC